MLAIRGATTVQSDREKDIRTAVENLMKQILEENNLKEEDIVSAIFSSTSDITAIYPARIFREMGYKEVPLFSCMEPPIRDNLKKCVRVLLHVDVPGERYNLNNGVRHVYLNEAKNLRPDLGDDDRQ